MTDPRLARYEAELPGRMTTIAGQLSQLLPPGLEFGFEPVGIVPPAQLPWPPAATPTPLCENCCVQPFVFVWHGKLLCAPCTISDATGDTSHQR